MKIVLFKVTVVFLCIITFLYIIIDNPLHNRFLDEEILNRINKKNQSSNMKYILQWTDSKNIPFINMKQGQSGFIERGCPHINCFVTDNKEYFPSYTKFDVIAFAGNEVVFLKEAYLPTNRSIHQKYVFATIESAANYPACTDRFDGYFNWTWSYRLDSEVKWGYIVIRNVNNEIIGPKIVMHWMKVEDMKPASELIRRQIGRKTKAAIWFVSNCFSLSARETFVRRLQHELFIHYNLVIDIYGECGPYKCARSDDNVCDKHIKDYYFYLSFENAFSEDYVTEKLLRGLNNDAVPIVYGGANYTRYMPDGIYLNAVELGVEKLAAKMDELIRNPDQYLEYFKWKNHYKYHSTTHSIETNEYCNICSLLNNEDMLKKTSVVENFREWWTPQNSCNEFYD